MIAATSMPGLRELALRRAVPVLTRLVEDPVFREAEILPLPDNMDRDRGWYAARRHDGENLTYSLQIFVWPPGSETKVHDHASWGALRCVVGSVAEERYERLDEGLRPGRARLKKVRQRAWDASDGVSTFLPYERGIHRVGNPGLEPAISVHLYGPRMGRLDGRDYEPSRDHVCDRMEARGFAGCAKESRR